MAKDLPESKIYSQKEYSFLTVTGACWGMGGSAILSLVALHQAAQNFNPCVKPAFCIIGIAAIILGFITAHFSKESGKVIESSCLEVQQDMKEINSMFFPNDNLDAEKISKEHLNVAIPKT